MIKISIIVAVYNTEEYLIQCIDSILNQSYSNIELILVNDGSTDASGKICDDYSIKDSRVIVIHKVNEGQSSARNTGLNIATGSYIGFVDSDDWIVNDMYRKLLEVGLKNESDIVACNLFLMTRKGDFINYSKSNTDLIFDKYSAMGELIRNQYLTFSPCNKLYKKVLFDDLRFDENIILEDKDISYKLITKCESIYYLKEPLYFYRYNFKSTLRSKFSVKRTDEYLVQNNMYDFYLRNYPSYSNLVYLLVFEVGLMLFISMKVEEKFSISEYTYLIDFDSNVLKQILNEKDVNIIKKVKVFLFLNIPNKLILLLELKYKFSKYFF